MPRKKEYTEDEVIKKAMHLFWKNGYETTSMKMLEQEMGVNKFSIYSSFGSKDGVFIECLKAYKKELSAITSKLKTSENGVLGIKQYFYDFLEFSKENNIPKGCLVTNSAVELNKNCKPEILNHLSGFTEHVKILFENNLYQEEKLDTVSIQEKTDYLIVSMFGLSSASKVFSKNQLDIYIENIFKNIT